MKKFLLSLSLLSSLFLSSMSLSAHPLDTVPAINLWPDGPTFLNGREAEGYDDQKQLFSPEIRIYLPKYTSADSISQDAFAPTRAVLICPGGGYSHLAMNHEGYDWVKYYNEQNIAAIVLKYRMPYGHHEVPSSDAYQALRYLKSHAAELNINPDKIGIQGFSAGGHLASTVATHAVDSLKPAFQILFYPVVTLDSTFTHKGTLHSLLGKNPNPELVTYYSNELQVEAGDPKAFIALSDDDNAVPSKNSVNYYLALRAHKVSATMHIYPTGGHGWGIRENFKYHDQVLEELSAWLKTIK